MSEGNEKPEFLTTREVAALLRVRERKVYDLVATGEIPCRRVTGKLLFPAAEIDNWLRGNPGVSVHAAGPLPENIIAGSHDPLLEWAIRESGCGLATAFDGSLDGIARIEAQAVAASGVHVFDPPSGEWNVPLVSERLSKSPVAVISWAARDRGLIVAHEAKDRIRGIDDLAGQRLVRRQPNAGASLLLVHLLSEAGMDASAIADHGTIAHTETEAAIAIASGEADATLGLRAVARQFNLPFMPLVTERYDLIVARCAWFSPPMQTLLTFSKSDALALQATELTGYNIDDLGTVRWNSPSA